MYFTCGLCGRADFLHIATAPKNIIPSPEGLCHRQPVAETLLALLAEDAPWSPHMDGWWTAVHSAALRSMRVPLLL